MKPVEPLQWDPSKIAYLAWQEIHSRAHAIQDRILAGGAVNLTQVTNLLNSQPLVALSLDDSSQEEMIFPYQSTPSAGAASSSAFPVLALEDSTTEEPLIGYPTLVPAGSDTQIQFNNAGVLGASANLTWNAVSGGFFVNNAPAFNFYTSSSSPAGQGDFFVQLGTDVNGVGGYFNFLAGPGSGNGLGGTYNFAAGNGSGSGGGGFMTFTAGSGGSTGPGGNFTLNAGSGTANTGGSFTVNAGSTTGAGNLPGSITMNAGTNATGPGGSITLLARNGGFSGNNNAGSVTITAGGAHGTGAAGTLTLTAANGSGTNAPGSNILMQTGTATGSGTVGSWTAKTNGLTWGLANAAGASQVQLTLGESTKAASVTNIVGPSAANTQANGLPILTGLAGFRATDATSTNATLTADASLTLTFNVTGSYTFEIWLPFWEATLGTGGFQFDLNSGTATVGTIVYGVEGFSTASVINAGVTSVATATAAGSIATSSSAPSWFLAKGYMGVTVAGTVAVRWAQNAISANATTLMTGAYFTATKIG